MDWLNTQRLFEALEPYMVNHDPTLLLPRSSGGRGGGGFFGQFGGGGLGGGGLGGAAPIQAGQTILYDKDDLLTVWHSTFAIVFGECGGMLACFLARREQRLNARKQMSTANH